MPSIWGASDQEQKKYGMRPGEHGRRLDGKRAIFGYVDPRPMPRGGYPPGETIDGVEIDRHPEALLRDHPRLWWIVHLWRSPVPRELPFDVVRQLYRVEREAWSVMQTAWYRARKGT
jgi:hypothetical protein